MRVLTSRENPRVRRWAKLVRDARFRRAERRALLEGPHLLDAFLNSAGRPIALLATETALAKPGIASLVARAGLDPVLLPEGVFNAVVDAETPQGIAAEFALADAASDLSSSPGCIFLAGLQDAGNVGTVLRSALAFGIHDVVLAKGCADVWSPKVLRAGAGAHFALRLADHADLADALGLFGGKVVCTVPRGGIPLPEADLSGRIGWIFGAEGQGVSEATVRRADCRVTIPLSPGSESLNVASAAAVCLYEAARRRERLGRSDKPRPE